MRQLNNRPARRQEAKPSAPLHAVASVNRFIISRGTVLSLIFRNMFISFPKEITKHFRNYSWNNRKPSTLYQAEQGATWVSTYFWDLFPSLHFYLISIFKTENPQAYLRKYSRQTVVWEQHLDLKINIKGLVELQQHFWLSNNQRVNLKKEKDLKNCCFSFSVSNICWSSNILKCSMLTCFCVSFSVLKYPWTWTPKSIFSVICCHCLTFYG